MKSRPLLRLAALWAACALITGCQPSVPDTLRIGVAQPLSGPLKGLGQDMLDGAQMAAADLNAAGLKVNGKDVKIEIVSADDKADAETGKAAAKTLVDAKVVAVIGHLNSGVSMAAAPLYADAKIPQLAISTKPEYTAMGLPTTFRLVANDALQSVAMGGFAAQLAGERVYAVVDDSTPYGKGLAEAAVKRMKEKKREVTLRRSLDDKTTDFAKLLEEMQAAKVNTLVTTLADFQVQALSEQAHQRRLRFDIVGSDVIKSDRLRALATPVGEVYATSPVIDANEFPGSKAFLAAFRGKYGHDPVYGAHYAYDAVHVLIDAIKAARTADGDKLIATLKKIDAAPPVTSSIRFADNGEQRYGMVSIYQMSRGEWQLLGRSDVW